MKLTVMKVSTFTRKADGSRFNRFTGKLSSGIAGQVALEGATADAMADVMVPKASSEGAYLTILFDAGWKVDGKPETFVNEAGVEMTKIFADLPVYAIRAVVDCAVWTIGEAEKKPTPKAALTPDELAVAVSAALSSLKKSSG